MALDTLAVIRNTAETIEAELEKRPLNRTAALDSQVEILEARDQLLRATLRQIVQGCIKAHSDAASIVARAESKLPAA